MVLKIKLIDSTLPMPSYQTAGSVGFDLYARVDVVVNPGSIALIPLNVIVHIPSGYMLLIASRSSTPRKKGLIMPNSVGIIDQDYCGEADEIMFQAYNFTKDAVTVLRGERIAQGILVNIATPTLTKTVSVPKKSRGGIGSTG